MGLHYKVVIVEDELPILENLAEKISALDCPFTIAGTATDGERGLELIQTLSPHILFTDIRMPIMDGLTLIEKARALLPDLKIVIISGYNEFEYAKRAIYYGVTDYLLKPVDARELEKTASRIVAELDEHALGQEREIMASRLAGGETLTGLPSDLSDCAFDLYLICLGGLYDRCYSALDLAENARLWERIDLPALLGANAAPGERWWLVSEKQPNCKILLLTARENAPERRIFAHITQKLNGQTAATVCGGGRTVGLGEIWKTAQQLRALLAKRITPCLPQFIAAEDTPPPDFFAARQRLDEVLLGCKSRQAEPLIQSIRTFLAACRQAQLPQQQLEQWLLLLTGEIGNAASADIDLKTTTDDMMLAVATAATDELLYAELLRMLENAAAQAFQSGRLAGELAEGIKRYIDERCLSPITVDTIAQAFHFSTSYITRIFKKRYGIPPFRYLLSLRIEAAKRLIETKEDLNISLVSEMVGYDDQHYFSRIFKSVTGLSPSEYKRHAAHKS